MNISLINKNIKLAIIFLVFLQVVMIASVNAEKVVLATTFPIYQFSLNVVGNYTGVRVELMLPAGLGCPHDYVLTPQDMRKLSRADLLVKNGLGMESFLGRALARVNPDLSVVDTSIGVAGLSGRPPSPGSNCGYDHGDGHDHCRNNHHGHEHGHDHDYINPHLFASPRHAAEVVMNIAAGLSRFDPSGAGDYFRNADAYATRLRDLADEFESLGKLMEAKRIVVQHDVFDYLVSEMGLEIVALLHVHPGQEPSAAEALKIIRKIKESGASAIFIEPQFSDRTARMISRESGVPVSVLDPVANGPADASLDYYEKVMQKNLQILRGLFDDQ